MKRIKEAIIIVSLLFATGISNAQLPSLDFVYGYTSDATLLLQEYIRPYANILGANLNGGWYNTAKPHKPGGFDITITTSIAMAPLTSLTYDLNNIAGLQTSYDQANSIAPTVAGKMDNRPVLTYEATVTNPASGNEETFTLASITHPDGLNVKRLPLPMAQATIGLFKGTDLSLRFFPTTQIRDYGKIGLFGIGGKHSISQWIPVLKRLKFINIAVQGGYTKVTTAAHLNMQPIAEVDISNPPDFDDQFLNTNISGWTVNLIASQSIPIITVYEGIGYSSSIVDMALTGHFPINSIVTEQGADFGKTTYVVVTDPISDLTFENYKNLRLNAGVRIKLGVLTLHYDFTHTLYSTHTAGIGVTFR